MEGNIRKEMREELLRQSTQALRIIRNRVAIKERAENNVSIDKNVIAAKIRLNAYLHANTIGNETRVQIEVIISK
jgi:hypothetical protein